MGGQEKAQEGRWQGRFQADPCRAREGAGVDGSDSGWRAGYTRESRLGSKATWRNSQGSNGDPRSRYVFEVSRAVSTSESGIHMEWV